MNTLAQRTSNSDAAYKNNRLARSVEYKAFGHATRSLTLTFKKRENDFASFAKALNDNLSLWRSLARDVAEPGNGLPASLRAQIFYLYEFTDQHTTALLGGTGSIQILLDINTAIMRGLSGQKNSLTKRET